MKDWFNPLLWARSIWAYTLAAKTYLQSWKWSLTVSGLQVLGMIAAVAVLMSLSWLDGRWSVSGTQQYVTTLFAAPEPDKQHPLVLPVTDNADTFRLLNEIERLEADKAEAEQRALNAEQGYKLVYDELNNMRAAQADASDTPRQIKCEPVVKWKRYCPRVKTVMEELGLSP